MIGRAFGLGDEAKGEEASALRLEAIADKVGLFLRGGGRVTLEEWLSLPPDEQAALSVMGDRMRTEAVIELARALQGPEGIADVARSIDDGDALVRLRLEQFADRLQA